MKDINVKYGLLLLCFLWGMSASFGQQKEISAKQHKKLAESAEVQKDFGAAIFHFSKYLESKTEDNKARYALAENYRHYRDYSNALKAYKWVYENPKNKNLLAGFYYAKMLQSQGKCEEAVPVYESFRKAYRGKKNDRKYMRLAKNQVEACRGEMEISRQEEIRISILDKSINGSHMEASPIFLSEDKLLYNSLKLAGENSFELDADSLPQRKFYLAKREGRESWKHVDAYRELTFDDGRELSSASFNPSKTRLYFSACKLAPTGKLDCDLYVIDLESGTKTPQKLPAEINSKNNESQVTVGLDEKGRELIYFVSDRKDGKGGLDIWYSRFDPKRNAYKTARNCGSKVNTVGDEMTPFFQPRNRKFYFSSDGHPGYGNLDVFEVAGERSKWSVAKNLGPMINSGGDELYFIENAGGEEGFFVSNQVRGESSGNSSCCDDLYFYQYLDKVSISIEGKVLAANQADGTGISKVRLNIYSLDKVDGSRFLEQSILTNTLGAYQTYLDPNTDYLIQVSKEGFLASEKRISTSENKESIKQDFTLEEISKQAILLENIYYKFDRSELTDEAKITIDTTLVPFLARNPDIIIELGSHTDNKGSAAYNRKLSQSRAESVVRYLREKGIPKKRLKARGYGMENPVAENNHPDGTDNPEGRAKNRRTEFRVIGKVEGPDQEDDWD